MTMQRQKGVALLMSLVILLVLSLLATSSMQNSIMQERMSTSSREGLLALEAAEAALREVEEDLEELTSLNGFGISNGMHDKGEAPAVFDSATWTTDSKSLSASEVDGITPRYFVEYRGPVSLTADAANGGGAGGFIVNLNFEGKGKLGGGGGGAAGTAGPGGADLTGKAESMRIVVMAQGPSDQSRKIIEAYYFVSAGNFESEG